VSVELEARLRTFLASSPRIVRPIETLEISHSAMSQTFFLWREPYVGTITTESGPQTVQPVNMAIKGADDLGDLDQKFEITMSTVDIDDLFREQLDLIPIDTLEKIVCIYRVYMSDDLTDIVAEYPLQVEQVNFQLGAATIIAVAPRFSTTRTGELYAPRDVPMLRAFL
jgi:hypothetical protein